MRMRAPDSTQPAEIGLTSLGPQSRSRRQRHHLAVCMAHDGMPGPFLCAWRQNHMVRRAHEVMVHIQSASLETAAIRYVHSTTPVFEWLMPDRIFKHGSAVNPSICDKSGKHQHCQQDAAADCICSDFPHRDWVLSQYRVAMLPAVTPNRRLHPLRSPYPRRS